MACAVVSNDKAWHHLAWLKRNQELFFVKFTFNQALTLIPWDQQQNDRSSSSPK